MKVEFGFCVACEKEIAPPCGGCGKRKPGTDYTEVLMPLSNGSQTHQPVCLGCAEEKVWKLDKAALTEMWHKAWADKGHPHDKDVRFV